MFAPASPPSAGWSSTDFEWLEVFNNTAAAIDFAATSHELDDSAGAAIAEENITEGQLPAGGVGILFNAAQLTAGDMATIWGAGKNYIPVTNLAAAEQWRGDGRVLGRSRWVRRGDDH